jgi:hypothetical protein
VTAGPAEFWLGAPSRVSRSVSCLGGGVTGAGENGAASAGRLTGEGAAALSAGRCTGVTGAGATAGAAGTDRAGATGGTGNSFVTASRAEAAAV